MLKTLFNGTAGAIGVGQMAAHMARSVADEVLTQFEPHYPATVRLARHASRLAGVPVRVSGRIAAKASGSTATVALKGLTNVLRAADRLSRRGPRMFLPFLIGALTLYGTKRFLEPFGIK